MLCRHLALSVARKEHLGIENGVASAGNAAATAITYN
jgi:hypothetical protein